MNSNVIFIIGAGRSGTNILRDTLSALDGLVSWPCDEINLIFRHGNIKITHDEFGPPEAHSVARKYIQKQFELLNGYNSNDVILEKTCANSLRINFLNEIFPKSKFIFIARNGYDVVASAKKRWTSSIELKYLIKKVKYVPFSDIPYYTFRFLKNRFAQLLSKEKKMGVWGPIYKGMQKDAKQYSLDEVCALQWAKCVKIAYDDLVKLSSDRVKFICYENFVTDPIGIINDLNLWIGHNWNKKQIINSVKNVRKSTPGKGLNSIDPNLREKISKIIDPVMERIYNEIPGK